MVDEPHNQKVDPGERAPALPAWAGPTIIFVIVIGGLVGWSGAQQFQGFARTVVGLILGMTTMIGLAFGLTWVGLKQKHPSVRFREIGPIFLLLWLICFVIFVLPGLCVSWLTREYGQIASLIFVGVWVVVFRSRGEHVIRWLSNLVLTITGVGGEKPETRSR
jgi:hypothetical protein